MYVCILHACKQVAGAVQEPGMLGQESSLGYACENDDKVLHVEMRAYFKHIGAFRVLSPTKYSVGVSGESQGALTRILYR